MDSSLSIFPLPQSKNALFWAQYFILHYSTFQKEIQVLFHRVIHRISPALLRHCFPSAAYPFFVIANQSSDWCGNLGRGATYQLVQEDSHGSVRTASE